MNKKEFSTTLMEQNRKLIPSLSQRRIEMNTVRGLKGQAIPIDIGTEMNMNMKKVFGNKIKKGRNVTINEGRNKMHFNSSSLNQESITHRHGSYSHRNHRNHRNKDTSLPSLINASIVESNAISCKERGVIKKSVDKIENCVNTQSAFFDRFHSKSTANMIFARSNNDFELNKEDYDNNAYDNSTKTTRESRIRNLKKLTRENILNLIPPVIRYSFHYNSSALYSDRDIFKPPNANQSNKTRKFIPYKFHTVKLTIQRAPKSQEFLKKCLSLKLESKNNIHLLFKMKCLKWLWVYKALIVEKFIYSFINFKWFFKKYEDMERKRFEEFLSLIGVGRDDEFCEQIYSIHNPYKTKKTINVKECFFFFVITSNSTYERKISFFIDIIEEDTTGDIDDGSEKMINIAKLFPYVELTMNSIDYQTCHSIIKKSIRDELLSKEDLLKQLNNCLILKKFLERYYTNFMNIDSQMQEEMNKTLNSRAMNSLKFLGGSQVKSYTPFVYKQLSNIISISNKTKKVRDEIHFKESTENSIISIDSLL